MTDVAEPDAISATAPFELHAGALRLAVRADLGGAVAGLWHGETPILRSSVPARLASARDSAMLLDTLDDMEAARELYGSLGFVEVAPYYFNPIPGAHYLKAELK